MNDRPSPPERDLPAGRHQQLKEHLMREIHRTDAPDQSPVARRRWLRPTITGPALAGALTIAVIAGVSVAGGGSSDSPSPTSQGNVASSPRTPVAPASIKDDQFVYIKTWVAKSKSLNVGSKGKPSQDAAPHPREVWFSVDNTRGMLLREPETQGEDIVTDGPDAPPGQSTDDLMSYYRNLEKLSTDPDALLVWMKARAREHYSSSDRSLDQDVWTMVGDYVKESLTPPGLSAALYDAAIQIPGVTVTPNQKDALGRPAVALTRTDPYNPGVRDVLLFDRNTKELLGDQTIRTEKKKDLIVWESATVERAVVDEKGQQPER